MLTNRQLYSFVTKFLSGSINFPSLLCQINHRVSNRLQTMIKYPFFCYFIFNTFSYLSIKGKKYIFFSSFNYTITNRFNYITSVLYVIVFFKLVCKPNIVLFLGSDSFENYNKIQFTWIGLFLRACWSSRCDGALSHSTERPGNWEFWSAWPVASTLTARSTPSDSIQIRL